MLNFIRENLMKRRDLLNDGAAHVGGSLAEVDIPSMLGKAIADAEFGKRKRFPSEAAEPWLFAGQLGRIWYWTKFKVAALVSFHGSSA